METVLTWAPRAEGCESPQGLRWGNRGTRGAAAQGGGSTDWALSWQWVLPVCLLEASHLPPSSVLFGDRWDSRARRNGGEEGARGRSH